MKKLLALIEEQLREVNTIVTCPVCGKRQLFELDDLSKIRLGNEGMYTGTGGMPMVQCEHCKAEGKTTLIRFWPPCFLFDFSLLFVITFLYPFVPDGLLEFELSF